MTFDSTGVNSRLICLLVGVHSGFPEPCFVFGIHMCIRVCSSSKRLLVKPRLALSSHWLLSVMKYWANFSGNGSPVSSNKQSPNYDCSGEWRGKVYPDGSESGGIGNYQKWKKYTRWDFSGWESVVITKILHRLRISHPFVVFCLLNRAIALRGLFSLITAMFYIRLRLFNSCR
jgi:hypothetical protein